MATSGVNKSQMLLKRMTFSLLPELRPLNVKNGLFFVFSADDSKKNSHSSDKVFYLKDLIFLSLLENAMDFWILSCHSKMATLKNTGFWYFLLTEQFF